MTLLVRDAENILRDNLEFHLRQGVDFFILTDNLSCDSTAAIIEEYVGRGLAEGIFEPDDTYMQSRWVTRMARRAAHLGADWVVNNDDDEFWRASSGTLRDALAVQPASCEALSVERLNHQPVADWNGRRFADAMCYRDTRSHNIFGEPLPPKVCHRAYADVEVFQGNHGVARAGAALAATDCPSLSISHFPLRDYAAFENKIAKGGAAYARNTILDPSAGATWRHLYDVWRAGGLRDWFDRQVLTPKRIADGLADGSLIEDRFLLDARH